MLLEAHQLTHSIGQRTLYRDLDLTIKEGEAWAILGINGSGKSTLLHTLAGLIQPTSGKITLDGKNIGNFSRRLVANRLGILLQQQNDEFPITVLETALAGCQPRLGLWGWESREDKMQALDWLDKMGLKGFEQRLTSTLSGGERRRLAIATLMMQQPQTALLDEPDNHLDPARRQQIVKLLAGHFTQQHHSAILSLHDVNIAKRYCSHILMLDGHGEWYSGTVTEMLEKEQLEWLYRCSVTIIEGPDGPVYLPGY